MNFLNPEKIISKINNLEGQTIADFGFGRGEFLLHLSKSAGNEGKVFAIDIQEELVKKVSEEFQEKDIQNTEFLTADLEQKKSTKILDNSIDFILISSIFFQSDSKKNILEEAVRILKTNGKILFIDWKESFSGIGPEEKNIFSQNEATKLFESFSLKLDREIESGNFHYALLYIKK